MMQASRESRNSILLSVCPGQKQNCDEIKDLGSPPCWFPTSILFSLSAVQKPVVVSLSLRDRERQIYGRKSLPFFGIPRWGFGIPRLKEAGLFLVIGATKGTNGALLPRTNNRLSVVPLFHWLPWFLAARFTWAPLPRTNNRPSVDLLFHWAFEIF